MDRYHEAPLSSDHWCEKRACVCVCGRERERGGERKQDTKEVERGRVVSASVHIAQCWPASRVRQATPRWHTCCRTPRARCMQTWQHSLPHHENAAGPHPFLLPSARHPTHACLVACFRDVDGKSPLWHACRGIQCVDDSGVWRLCGAGAYVHGSWRVCVRKGRRHSPVSLRRKSLPRLLR